MLKPSSEYNLLAGQDETRTKALADGVFAFAVTVLVLGLSIMEVGTIFQKLISGSGLFLSDPNFLYT